MAEAQINIGKFNGGEISPRAQGHLELPQYKAGGQELLNVIPNLVGGLERRQGTQFVSAATGAAGSDRSAFTSNGSWLIPFDIADGSSYVLEFSDRKLRFYRDGGVLLVDNAPFTPSNVNITANQFEISGHGLQHGQLIKYNKGTSGGDSPTANLFGDSVEFLEDIINDPLDPTPAGSRFAVVLPEAMRTVNPTAASRYDAEQYTVPSPNNGSGLFGLQSQMGPYHITGSDVNASPVGRDVYISATTASARDATKVSGFTVAASKGGTALNPGTKVAGSVTVTPTLEALSSTFRIALPKANLCDLIDDVYEINTVGTTNGFWSVDDPETTEVIDSRPYEIPTPWTVEEATRLQYSKDGDVMIIASGIDGHPLYRLQRVGVSSFSLTREKVEGGPLGFQSPFGPETTMQVGTTGIEVGNTPTWTASSGVFRGTDVGRPIRKTFTEEVDGLRHIDGIITSLGAVEDAHVDFTCYSRTAESVLVDGWLDVRDCSDTNLAGDAGCEFTTQFEVGDLVWISEHPSHIDGSSLRDFPNEILTLNTPYYVVEKLMGIPDVVTGFFRGQHIRISATLGGDPITEYGLFGSLFRHYRSITITKADLTAVSAANQYVSITHGFADGTEFAGLWIEGTPPQGLQIGRAYKIRTHPTITSRFRLVTMNDEEVPISNAGSGRFTCNASQDLQTTVTARFIRKVGTGTALVALDFAETEKWRLGQWNGRDGYPGAVAIHQERLIAAGSNRFPMVVWGSEQAIFNSYVPDSRIGSEASPNRDDRSIIESSAWNFAFDSATSQRILWVFPSTVVLVGTSGPIHQLTGFTPTTLQGELVTNKGSSGVRPVISDSQIVWGSNKSYRVLGAAFDERRGGLLPEDLTLLADHVFTGQNRLIQLSLQEEPWSLVWGVREDGLLWSCTYDREQGVKAWAQHKIGGTHSLNGLISGSSASVEITRDHANVKSICTIPSSDERFQELWMVVERHAIPSDGSATTVDNVFRSIEFMTRRFELDDRDEDAYYVDCGIAAQEIPVDGNGDPIAAANFTGHDVLANRSLASWIDADDAQVLTADALGTVILQTPATSKLIAGIPYSWRWRSLSVESILSDIPTPTGMQSNIPSLAINVVRSRGGSIGTPTGAAMQRIDYSQISKDIIGEPIPLRTGRIQIDSLPDSPGRTNELILEGEGAAPFFCTNIVARITGGQDGR